MSRTLILSGLTVLLSVGSLSTQVDHEAAKQAFEHAFVAAIRARDQVALAKTRAQIENLAPELRTRARFGVGVRLAEIYLGTNDLERAGKECLEARRAAREDGVYAGSVRALALVILWQVYDAKILDRGERAYLRSNQPIADAAHLRVPIELIRTDLDEDEGQFGAALERVRSLADELRAAGVDAADVWRQKVVLRLFWIHFVRRRYDTAKVYLGDLPTAISLWPRALIALRQRDYETAEKAARRLAQRDRVFRFLLGDVLEERGKLDDAQAIYESLLVNKDPVLRAFAQRGLGDCLLGRWLRDTPQDRDDLKLAQTYFEQALAVFDRAQSTQMLAEQSAVMRQLGRVFEALGDIRRAHSVYSEALKRANRGRLHASTDAFGGSWFNSTSKHDYLASVDGLLRTAAAVDQDPVALLLALEVGKARTLLDWIDNPPHIDDRARVRATVRELTNSTDPEAQRRLVSQRGAQTGSQAAVVTRTELEQMLTQSNDAMFLSYWLGETQCWVVWTLNGESGIVGLGAAVDARHHLGAAARIVANPDSRPWTALDSAAEYFVPAELRPRISRASQLVFCPDSRLGRLPFEALRVDGQALGISHGVERAPSLSVRQRLSRRSTTADGVVVVDSISDEAASGLGLDPLRFTAREGELVASAYEQVIRLRGVEATLDGLRRHLQSGALDMVHLNAHAFAARIPTASVLVLQDGPVSVASLAELPVHGAFVVMSACSSAAGELRGGEGEIGLLGWPFASGARGAVAALWSVNQQATADLMGQFHHYRAAGETEVQAMRAARAALAATQNYAHPHYWAGFGVYGPGDVGSGASRLAWFAGLGLALAVMGLRWRRRRAQAAS